MMDLISIIVPVYNGEKYLDSCFQRLQSQTYTKYEVIFINDGSTDESLEILNKYQAMDNRVKIINQHNQGVSAARNIGLQAAGGGYVAFIDIDDRIKLDYLERLVNTAIDTGADIVCCGIEGRKIIAGTEVITDINCPPSTGWRIIKDVFNDAVRGYIYPLSVWGKLYKRELAIKTSFKSIRYGEDSEYFFSLLHEYEPSIYLLTYVGYEYMNWEQSATHNPEIKDKLYENAKYGIKRTEKYIWLHADDVLNCICDYMNRVVTYLVECVKLDKKDEFVDFAEDDFFCVMKKELKLHNVKLTAICRFVLLLYRAPNLSYGLLKALLGLKCIIKNI